MTSTIERPRRAVKRRRIIDEVMAQLCVYGGLLATRAEVYEHLCAVYESKGLCPKKNFLSIDRLTWQPPEATPEQADYCRRVGLVWADRAKLGRI